MLARHCMCLLVLFVVPIDAGLLWGDDGAADELVQAAEAGDLIAATALLAKGAKVDGESAHDGERAGLTALMAASAKGQGRGQITDRIKSAGRPFVYLRAERQVDGFDVCLRGNRPPTNGKKASRCRRQC